MVMQTETNDPDLITDEVCEYLLGLLESGEFVQEQARRIRLARHALEISRAEMAKSTTIGFKTYKKIELGTQEARLSQLIQIARASGQKLGYLRMETDEFIGKPTPNTFRFKHRLSGKHGLGDTHSRSRDQLFR